MARILYGIMGDARGHLSRSVSVVQHMPGHEVLFAGGGKVLELRDQGRDVVELPMLATLYKNTSVDFTATVTNALKVLAGRRKVMDRLARVVEDFDPHLIISDYEYFLPLAARRLGRPCLSLDHQHVLTHCAYNPPRVQKLNRALTFFPIKRLYSNASRYLVSSFYELPPRDPATTEVAPPILRESVREFAPSKGEHVVVYTSGGAYEALTPFLELLHRPCRVYGFGRQPSRGRVEFMPYSERGFLEDLASCRYVISNGGHNLISESLYYVKPVLCLPINFLYEQFLNAYFLQEFGFGLMCMQKNGIRKALQKMESNLEVFEEQIRKYSFWGNDVVVSRLEGMLAEATRGQ